MARTVAANVYTTESFSYAYSRLYSILLESGMTKTAATRAADGMITEAELTGWDGVRVVKVEVANGIYTITNKSIAP